MPKGDKPMRTKRFKRLSRFEKKVATSLAETMAPPECGIALCHRDVEMVAWLDDYIEKSILLLRIGVIYLFSLIELSPIFFGYGPRRFSSLPLDKRDEYLNKWRDIKIWPLSMTMLLIRLLIGFSFYQDERVLVELGYDLPRMRQLAITEIVVTE